MNGKDTIYIDPEEEITGVIDKVRSSDNKVVALVLPKRASMLQSTVNMKLLKRSADSASKQLVLVTSEAGLMPLAGAIGLPVARTLDSKPEVPEAAQALDNNMDDMLTVDETPQEFSPESAADKPVGELANQADSKPGQTPGSNVDPDETIELDNSEPAAAAASEAGKKVGKKSKDKKTKVPNFNKFRKRLLIAAGVLVLLIVLWFIGFKILPRATVTIGTKTTSINSSVNMNLSTSANALNPSNDTVPAQTEQQQKSYTASAPATGTKNEGNTASGSVTMTAQKCSPPFSVPSSVASGTGISANGLTFVTKSTASFSISSVSGGCINYSSGSVPITAQSPGSQYNVNNADFSVSGRSEVNASGSTSGGSTKNVTVIQQSDIDSAKAKLSGKANDNAIKQQLQQSLQSNNLYPITATYKASSPNISASAKVGDQTSNVTVTESVTYTMFGVKQSDLQTLLDNDVNGQIDTNKQSIQNDGLDKATFSVSSETTNTAAVTMQATATVGPKLDTSSIKSQIAGKKSGEVESIVNSNPQVTSVDVHFSPFWVNKVPTNTSKITIKYKSQSNSNGN